MILFYRYNVYHSPAFLVQLEDLPRQAGHAVQQPALKARTDQSFGRFELSLMGFL